MKKLFILCLSVLLLISAAAADPVDLSGMSYDDLVALRDQLNLAIWNSREWQEITVPAGIWTVGEDIPAGHWSIRVAGELSFTNVIYFEKLDRASLGPDYNGYYFLRQINTADMAEYGLNGATSLDLNMQAGWYFQCDKSVIFTPYSGKPDLGFK